MLGVKLLLVVPESLDHNQLSIFSLAKTDNVIFVIENVLFVGETIVIIGLVLSGGTEVSTLKFTLATPVLLFVSFAQTNNK